MARRTLKRLVLGDEALRLVASRFRALGDPSRLRILNVLMRGPHAVGEVLEEPDLEQSNVSRHLAVLRREGLVARRSEGSRAVYRIVDPSLVELCELVCSGIADRLSDALDALPESEEWRGSGI